MRMNFMLAIFFIILFGLPDGNGLKVTVTISAAPPLTGLICADKPITFTCSVTNVKRVQEYQWWIDGNDGKIGKQKYTMQNASQSVHNVTCKVYATSSNGQMVSRNSSVTFRPNGNAPQIQFQYITNHFVYELTSAPFNLTATVVSHLNLTSLYWSPPEYSDPLPYRTIILHHGNITTITFMLSRHASLGDSGNYTLTAVNECGRSSSQVRVEVLTDCPPPVFTEVQPQNFTAVEGYNTSLKCSFDGDYSPSSPIRVWALLPGSQKPVWLDEQFYPDCGCWAESKQACSADTNPNDCCRFELIMHSIPHVNETGTAFSCTKNFTNAEAAWMYVVPSPKVIEPPHNLSTTVGSKAVFTCDFEAATDNRISQIHWVFNGYDLAGCKRFQDRINCTVTQSSPDTNYISSTLEIHSVQADNAGQYTCYCSYDTNALNVDGDQVIQSPPKSATLSVQSGSSPAIKLFIIIGISAGVLVIIIIVILFIVFHHVRVRYIKRRGYKVIPGNDEPLEEPTDEVLDRYVVEELFPFWHKLGKALHLEDNFLQETFDNYQEPAERIKIILIKWRDTAKHPSLTTLHRVLEMLGLKDLISRIKDVRRLHLHDATAATDPRVPVGGPGPMVNINREGRILPGINSRPAEIKDFQGVLRCGLPPLTVLTIDLQEEWEELGTHMGLQQSHLEHIKMQHLSQTMECCWAIFTDWLDRNLGATWDDLIRTLELASLQWNTIASGLRHYLKSLVAEADGQSKRGKSVCAILRKRYKEIVEHVNPEQLMVQLITRNLITSEEGHMLMNDKYTPQKRTKLLILQLFSKNPNTSIQLFCECLRAEKEHTGHEYLADLLEKDICAHESQQQQATHNRGATNSNAAAITESEIDNLLPTLKSCWMQVAEMVSAPHQMVNDITASSQDPEEQARMFLQHYTVVSRKENIYQALDQLGVKL